MIKNTSTRFEFEQLMLDCWKIVDDLELLRKKHLDGVELMTEDEIDNYHLSLITLYGHKFDSLFTMFEKLVWNRMI